MTRFVRKRTKMKGVSSRPKSYEPVIDLQRSVQNMSDMDLLDEMLRTPRDLNPIGRSTSYMEAAHRHVACRNELLRRLDGCC